MFDRIVSEPAILSGKPCIKGTRISVEFILELVASGASAADIVRTYPQLTIEDVDQAVRSGSELDEAQKAELLRRLAADRATPARPSPGTGSITTSRRPYASSVEPWRSRPPP